MSALGILDAAWLSPPPRPWSDEELHYGQCGVMVTGACRGEWCPIEVGHQAGWAHRHYLAMVSRARYRVTAVASNDVLKDRLSYGSP